MLINQIISSQFLQNNTIFVIIRKKNIFQYSIFRISSNCTSDRLDENYGGFYKVYKNKPMVISFFNYIMINTIEKKLFI